MKDGDGKTRAINQCNDQLQAKYKPQVRAVIQQAGPKLAAAYTQHYQDRAACLQYREAALRELPTAARGGQFELRAVAQNWEIARNMNLTLGMVCTSNSDQFANTIGAVFAPGGG